MLKKFKNQYKVNRGIFAFTYIKFYGVMKFSSEPEAFFVTSNQTVKLNSVNSKKN